MPPAFRALGELYAARWREVAALWSEGTCTLIHGDDHIGNLFVDGERTGFFDWAVASRFPGMRDVAYFLGNSLPPEVRRAEEDALLARYRGRWPTTGSNSTRPSSASSTGSSPSTRGSRPPRRRPWARGGSRPTLAVGPWSARRRP